MNDLTNLLYLQNPWWREENYLPLEDRLPRREIFDQFLKEIFDYRQIISLTGLRRTGKSTLLRQMIAQLLKKIPARQIFYFSFDSPTVLGNKEVISQTIEFYLREIKQQKLYNLEQTCYLFFDEIQLVPFWQDILKRYYDLSPYLKFIVTGSASLFIRKKSAESLAGRIFERQLPPLSFLEYKKLFTKEDFNDYLEFGGFPELVEMESREKKIEYLKEWIIQKIIKIDLPTFSKIRRPADLERLFWVLVGNAGQIIKFPSLSSDLGLKAPTLFKYLTHLESALLIQSVLNFAGSFRSQSRVLRKLYPSSPNFLSLLPTQFPNTGLQAETYVANYLLNKYKTLGLYSLRQKEIDFLLPEQKIAIEIKYQPVIHPEDYRFLAKFIKAKKYRGILITKNFSERIAADSIKCLPIIELEQNIL